MGKRKADQFMNPDLLAVVISDVWDYTLLCKFQKGYTRVIRIRWMYNTYLLGVHWVFLSEVLVQGLCLDTLQPSEPGRPIQLSQ